MKMKQTSLLGIMVLANCITHGQNLNNFPFSDNSYQGKPESYWLNTLTNQNPEFFMHRLEPGWSLLGTNVLPLAARGLAKWGKDEAVQRNISIIFQGTVDPKTYVELATNNGNPYIRGLALSGLTFDSDKAVTSLMVDALNDTNPEVELATIGGLGLSVRQFIPGELPALVHCLQSSDPDVRFNSAMLLCAQQQNGPQAGLTYHDIAEAAFVEIKKATTNSDPHISQAATKALQVNPGIREFALTAYANELDISRVELTGKQWTATLKAVDENNRPISGEEASIGYHVQNVDVAGEIESAYQEIKGITDSNGIFVASHKGSFPTEYHAGNIGYYPSIGTREGAELDDNDPAKWHPTVTLVLKKKIHPIPMYVNRVDFAHGRRPGIDRPIGFDLTVGDWVAPYGKGKKAYMFFTWHLDYDTNSVTYGRHGGEETMTISFPNPSDGIQEFDFPLRPNNRLSEGSEWSELHSPQLAPIDGYQPDLVKLSRWNYHHLPNEFDYDYLHKNYFVRVNTVTDAGGKIISAQYGKIYGDFEQAVSTYLNPEPNSREIEYNKHNLGPGGNNSYFIY
jgi:hypothetical protein